MKMSLVIFWILLISGCANQVRQSPNSPIIDRGIANQEYFSMFSPWQGREAFAKLYGYISKANQEVKVSVYSWSDTDFDRALIAAATNNAIVKVVLHAPLGRKASLVEKMKKMEEMKFSKGKISFKIATRNMHEKFVIVDGETLINASANMSNGAKTSYSENFVFLTGPDHIIENFENEFAILWNSSKDVISQNDAVEEKLPYNPSKHHTEGKDITFYSSSMNYNYPENAPTSAALEAGQYIKLSPKGGGKGPWTVRDAILKAIKAAEKSIYCSFNHFNIQEIADALVEASARGVDVKLTVDNQEFRENRRPDMIEMTPRFVDSWKELRGNAEKEAPVRVKFYSHYPNPSVWLLNHHKFLLIDYNKSGGSDKSILFTGSYNLSETAEHNQFDNMVTFKGKKYFSLQDSFLGEFEKLWSLERNSDKPNPEILSFFTTVQGDSLPIHYNRAIALSWSEIESLRAEIKQMEPEFLRQLNMKMSSCRGFNVKTKKLWGCAH